MRPLAAGPAAFAADLCNQWLRIFALSDSLIRN